MPFDILKTVSQPWNDAIEAYAAGLDGVIAGHLATIASLTAEIAALNTTITTLNATIANRDAQIVGLNATIAARDATIAARDALIVVLEARIAELEAGGGGEPPPPPSGPPVPAEMIVKSWYQETVVAGSVASWQSGGVKPVAAVQGDPALQPVKLANNGGVLFAKDTKQSLTWPSDNDAPWLHRWWVVIARADMAANPTASEISLLSVNSASGGPAYRQPRIGFNASDTPMSTMFSQLNDGNYKTEHAPCETDFATWNVMIGYRRGHQLQLVVNGVKTAGQELLRLSANNAGTPSFMGDPNTFIRADAAIDCVLLGQSELSDAQIDKLVGWAMWRVGRQASLPVDHPYRNAAPTGVDNPTRYAFSQAEWDAWRDAIDFVTSPDGVPSRYAHRGEPAPAISGYTTVFEDDFATNTVVDDLTGAPGSNWFAPTHVVGVGVDAVAQRVSSAPSCYIHDAANHTLSLRMLNSGGQWRTGAFSSIDNNGQGRTWGKGIFEIRCKFPQLSSPRPGFFPAFWGYAKEHLFWRTRNRLEHDFFEYDGLNGAWINSTLHVHSPALAFADPGVRSADILKKVANYAVGPATSFPALIDIYNGQFHTWYWQIEDDFTYIVLDDLEVARFPTSREIAAEKYIIVDWAYRSSQGAGDPAQVYDMTIDYIRVRQKF